ncbi:MAG: lysophospholipid acyltransferase family protein [Candidatus Kapaibacterium sp.]
MSSFEYVLRLVAVVLSTCVRGVVFLLHRTVSGSSSITYAHVRGWCRHVLSLSGVRVRGEGMENLDASASYIYVANHASLFDIPALQVALPGNVRIMYKKELQKIPFMGWALRYSSFIPIVREKARDAMNTVNATVETIRNDDSSLMIFPEGTRSEDGDIGKFKRGAFIVALQSGKPLVPVAICGSFDVLSKHSLRFRKGEIVVRAGRPVVIETRIYTREEEILLMNSMHAAVAELLHAS